MTNAEYHSRPELSKSDLDLLAKSPYHFKNKDKFRYESKAFNIGSAVHTLVLEPELFDDEYIVEKIDKRTKAGKELLAKALEENKTILTPDEYEEVKAMAESVNSIKHSATFLSNGKAEQSYFSELHGVPVRCRPDFYNEKLGIVVDLKTTVDASRNGFLQSVGKFNYHVQVAFYTDVMRSLGLKVNSFLFIAVEKKAPYMVGFYDLSTSAIEEGRSRYQKLLDRYKYCKENNEWWGYAEFDDLNEQVKAVQTLELPAWKYYE